MPEGVTGYPRWDGPLSTGPLFPVIAAEEIRRAFRSLWVQMVLLFVMVIPLMALAQINRVGAVGHTMDAFLQVLRLFPWGALALGAIVGAPMLLEDRRQGALELYLARAVTRGDYLAGKGLALFSLAAVAIIAPALVYYVVTLVLFNQHPAGWELVPAGIFLLGLLWGTLVTGLALGLSSVARSGAAASIILFGAFAVAHFYISDPLPGIVRDQGWRVISPFVALEAQESWLFGTAASAGFPEWWGLAVWAVLAVLGWGLVAWKHPRLAGDGSGSARV